MTSFCLFDEENEDNNLIYASKFSSNFYFFFSAVNYQTLFVCFKGSMAVVCRIAWSSCRYLQRSPMVRPNHNNPSTGHLLEGQTFNPVLHWTETGLFYCSTPGHLKWQGALGRCSLKGMLVHFSSITICLQLVWPCFALAIPFFFCVFLA